MMTIRILHIDDNPLDARLVQAALADARQVGVPVKFALETAPCLTEGLKRLKEGVFDLILLDFHLPDGMGTDLLVRVHGEWPDIPVVILTGTFDEKYCLDAVKLGAQDYLLKENIEPQLLSRTLRNAIDRHRIMMELRLKGTELMRSRTQFMSLIQNQADAVIVVNEEGIVQYANAAAEELYGRPAAEIVGSGFGSAIGSSSGTLDVLCGAETRTAEFRQHETTWNGSAAEIVTLRDVTAREKDMAEIRLLNDIFQQTAQPIAMSDFEGRLIRFNRAYVSLTGYPESELRLKACSDLTPEKWHVMERAVAERVTASGRPERYEKEYVRKDGSIIPLELSVDLFRDENGGPQFLYAFVTDISERKAVEAERAQVAAEMIRKNTELEQSRRSAVEMMRDAIEARERFEMAETRFSRVFTAAPFPIMIYTEDGEIVKTNPAWSELSGYGLGEIQTLAEWAERAHTAPDGSIVTALVDVCRSEQRISEGEMTVRAKNGETKIWELTTAPLGAAPGAKRLAVRIGVDVTERKKLAERFEAAQRMEAIGRLAGGVAHDFNNLLMAVTSFAELASLSLHKSDAVKQCMDEIQAVVDRGSGLTRQLLAFSRKQITQVQIVDLNDIVRNLDRMMARLIGAEILIECRLSDAPMRIQIDPGQMEQVMLNLVINSRDAIGTEGVITIETSKQPADPNGEAEEAHPAEYIALAVRDTGSGMSEEIKKHIFEPFFTTKEKGKGTGLGLATCYGIVTQAGGRIDVDSVPGAGTTFRVLLPEATGTAELPRAERSVRWAAASRHERILLVEDDEHVRRSISGMLSALGYQVVEAVDGEAGLAAFQSGGEADAKIDLVLTDVSMPKLDGLQMAEQIRLRRSDSKIIFMSGYMDDVRAGGLVLNDFLQKPIRPDVLSRKIAEVMNA